MQEYNAIPFVGVIKEIPPFNGERAFSIRTGDGYELTTRSAPSLLAHGVELPPAPLPFEESPSYKLGLILADTEETPQRRTAAFDELHKRVKDADVWSKADIFELFSKPPAEDGVDIDLDAPPVEESDKTVEPSWEFKPGRRVVRTDTAIFQPGVEGVIVGKAKYPSEWLIDVGDKDNVVWHQDFFELAPRSTGDDVDIDLGHEATEEEAQPEPPREFQPGDKVVYTDPDGGEWPAVLESVYREWTDPVEGVRRVWAFQGGTYAGEHQFRLADDEPASGEDDESLALGDRVVVDGYGHGWDGITGVIIDLYDNQSYPYAGIQIDEGQSIEVGIGVRTATVPVGEKAAFQLEHLTVIASSEEVAEERVPERPFEVGDEVVVTSHREAAWNGTTGKVTGYNDTWVIIQHDDGAVLTFPTESVELVVDEESSVVTHSTELDNLRRWKEEAMIVMDEWVKVWIALGNPGTLGESIAKASAKEVDRLQAKIGELLAELDSIRTEPPAEYQFQPGDRVRHRHGDHDKATLLRRWPADSADTWEIELVSPGGNHEFWPEDRFELDPEPRTADDHAEPAPEFKVGDRVIRTKKNSVVGGRSPKRYATGTVGTIKEATRNGAFVAVEGEHPDVFWSENNFKLAPAEEKS